MKKKQSSLEWYIEESFKLQVKFDRQEISQEEYMLAYDNLLQQAKARHEWEIYYALDAGYEIAIESKKFKHIQSSAQYYNETFGGEDE